ncbi:MAG: potassium channel family protein [Geminicoccaceae bacterium]|nr:potassium channel family protein [Geminicoccaceae bacterium]
MSTAEATEAPDDRGHRERLRDRLRELYFGSTRRAAAFQYGLLAFDFATITFFLVVSFVHEAPWILVVDLMIAVPLTLDFAARLYIAPQRLKFLISPTTLADLIVILSLLIAPFSGNFAFLRVLRAIRMLRSYHVLGLLRRRNAWVRRNEEIIQSTINLFVFIFVCTAIVYVSQVGHNDQIYNYIDALYFTIAALTTTGFGDVTLVGQFGRFLSVLIMIFGISLFLRLVQTVFRPSKVRFTCPECGLTRHDPDAVHCKHCGTTIHIPNEGL